MQSAVIIGANLIPYVLIERLQHSVVNNPVDEITAFQELILNHGSQFTAMGMVTPICNAGLKIMAATLKGTGHNQAAEKLHEYSLPISSIASGTMLIAAEVIQPPRNNNEEGHVQFGGGSAGDIYATTIATAMTLSFCAIRSWLRHNQR